MRWSADQQNSSAPAILSASGRSCLASKLGEAWVLASETCASTSSAPISCARSRTASGGDHQGRDREPPFRAKIPGALCIFEYIYFARPDSIVGGRSVYDAQGDGPAIGARKPANADVIVPVPDSGVPAAMGFAQESGIPYELGIIRNHYVGRTFIEPEQRIRQLGVKLKHSANEAQVRGKRIVLIDDSVVRGTTSVKIVQMMREAGAKEVHMRISSPPITHPDFYGIDTPDQDKLLAATKTLEQMRTYMGADTLAFLSVEGIYKAMGYEGRDSAHPQFTDHCFTGEYPTRLRDREGPPQQKQLSFLAEVG
jgi:amidophosphoribosyltransferase